MATGPKRSDFWDASYLTLTRKPFQLRQENLFQNNSTRRIILIMAEVFNLITKQGEAN